MRSARASGSQPIPTQALHYRAPSRGGLKEGSWVSPSAKVSPHLVGGPDRLSFKDLTTSAVKSHSREPQQHAAVYALDSYRNGSLVGGPEWHNQSSRSRSSSKNIPSVALTNELRNFSRKKQRENLLRSDSGKKWAQSTKEPFASLAYRDATAQRLDEGKISFKDSGVPSRTYHTKPMVLAVDRKSFLTNYATGGTGPSTAASTSTPSPTGRGDFEAPSSLYHGETKDLKIDEKREVGTGSRMAHEWGGIRMHGLMDPDANIAGLRSKLAQTLSSSRANRVANKKYILEAGNTSIKPPESQRDTLKPTKSPLSLMDGFQQSRSKEAELARIREKIQEVLHNLEEEKRIFEAKYEDVCSSITQAHSDHDLKMKELHELRSKRRTEFESQLKELLADGKTDQEQNQPTERTIHDSPLHSTSRQRSLDISLAVSHVPDSGSSPPHV